MKNLFAILIAFALIFAACGNGSEDNSDVIGVWSGSYTGGTLTLDIADGTWIMVFNDTYAQVTANGTWTRDANTLTLERGYYYEDSTASLSEGKLFLTQRVSTIYSRPSTITLTKKVDTPPAPSVPPATGTTLKINNQSFTEITDVIWNNVSFAENQYENSIKSGNNVTKNVEAGGGYIFFKRKSSPITARTRDVIIVEAGKSKEFVFIDETVIIEVNNTANSGTLGALQSTVVFWDDAEGEMQPYYEARSFVGYYSVSTDLPSKYSTSYNVYHPVKNGNKSIAVGGTTTAMLHIKINLTRNAKLSFWYANKIRSNTTTKTTFSINNEETRTWTTDVNWSFMEVELEPGVNDITWEKKDGGDLGYNNASYYLSLDDILIYYTE